MRLSIALALALFSAGCNPDGTCVMQGVDDDVSCTVGYGKSSCSKATTAEFIEKSGADGVGYCRLKGFTRASAAGKRDLSQGEVDDALKRGELVTFRAPAGPASSAK